MVAKKLYTLNALLLTIFIFTSHIAYGQEEKKMTHAFLIDPVGIAVGTALGDILVAPEYQWTFNDYLALDVISGYMYLEENTHFTHPPLHGFSTEIGLRIYPFGKAPSGLYIVPRAGVGYASGSGESVTGLVATAEVGYSWTWGPPGLIINLGAGGGGIMPVSGSLKDSAGNYLVALINLSIGFGF